MEDNLDNKREKCFLDSSIFTFLFAPMILVFIVPFLGFSIFHSEAKTNKQELKKALLLSSGAVFYLVLLLVAISGD